MSYPDTRLFIDGQWCDSANGQTLAVLNPATGKGDRVGFRILDDGRKVRFFKSNGEVADA